MIIRSQLPYRSRSPELPERFGVCLCHAIPTRQPHAVSLRLVVRQSTETLKTKPSLSLSLSPRCKTNIQSSSLYLVYSYHLISNYIKNRFQKDCSELLRRVKLFAKVYLYTPISRTHLIRHYMDPAMKDLRGQSRSIPTKYCNSTQPRIRGTRESKPNFHLVSSRYPIYSLQLGDKQTKSIPCFVPFLDRHLRERNGYQLLDGKREPMAQCVLKENCA